MSHVARRTVRAAVLTAAVLGLAAGIPAAPKPEDPGVRLSKRLAALAVQMRTTRRQEARAELREEIEWIKHRLGPTDAAGRRLTCEAMWHDAALRDLERAVGRTGGTGADPPAGDTPGAAATDAAPDADAPTPDAPAGPAPEGYWSNDAAGKTKAEPGSVPKDHRRSVGGSTKTRRGGSLFSPLPV